MQNMRCVSHFGRLKAKVGIHLKCIFPYHQKRHAVMQLCVSRKHLMSIHIPKSMSAYPVVNWQLDSTE